jgi:hypothetical protein
MGNHSRNREKSLIYYLLRYSPQPGRAKTLPPMAKKFPTRQMFATFGVQTMA